MKESTSRFKSAASRSLMPLRPGSERTDWKARLPTRKREAKESMIRRETRGASLRLLKGMRKESKMERKNMMTLYQPSFFTSQKYYLVERLSVPCGSRVRPMKPLMMHQQSELHIDHEVVAALVMRREVLEIEGTP